MSCYEINIRRRGGLSLEMDNFAAFNYLSASGIWPHKRVAIGGRVLINGGLSCPINTVTNKNCN
jgi:hypothetical protein